jgi:hypothetical protein
VPAYTLHCADTDEGYAELVKFGDKTPFTARHALECPNPHCRKTVGFGTRGEVDVDWIRESFRLLMEQHGGCPCCKPGARFIVNA